nr:hypothetical protein [Scytonema millei]
MGINRFGGNAIFPNAPTWGRGNAYGYHARNSHGCGRSLHAARHRVRGYCIRKAVSLLLHRDNPDTSRVWHCGRVGRFPAGGKLAYAVDGSLGAY